MVFDDDVGFETIEHKNELFLSARGDMKTVQLKELKPYSHEIASKLYACKMDFDTEEKLREAKEESAGTRDSLVTAFRDKMDGSCKPIKIGKDQEIYIDGEEEEIKNVKT